MSENLGSKNADKISYLASVKCVITTLQESQTHTIVIKMAIPAFLKTLVGKYLLLSGVIFVTKLIYKAYYNVHLFVI